MRRVLIAGVGFLILAGNAVAVSAGSPAARILDKLKAVADSPGYYWAWTHPWMDPWVKTGDPRHALVTEEGISPKPTADVKLECGYAKFADGRRTVIGYSDLAGIAGTWNSPRYYTINRASLTAAIKRHWREFGGITVFSWHLDQPYCTNGFRQASYRFKSSGENRNVVRQILDGTGAPCGTGCLDKRILRKPFATPRDWYLAMLRDAASFFNGLVDEETGEKIPVILRHPHEMDGGWFWWGRGWCTPEEFRRFCRMTADYLRKECGDGQILFAYTPDRTWKEFGTEGEQEKNTFLSYYPGDGYVDLVGFDDYSIGHGDDNVAETALTETVRKLRLVSAFAKERGKVAALTETGGRNKRDDFWVYLHRIMTADGVHCAFVDTWGGCYGTLPDTPASEKDEIAFARRPEVLMEGKTTGLR
ncbi:MAG: hypothetical protein IJR99_15300 [Kiritimatiellae bacterium]|nr:hypothetical protein [Kiritimatiellia bacterium]